MQDGSFGSSRARKTQPWTETSLPWTRRQLSEAGKEPVEVSRGQSMRRRLLLVGKSGAKAKTGRANEVAGDGLAAQWAPDAGAT